MELAGKNIRINSVCPGATQTRMLEKSSVVNLDRQLLGMLSPEQIASCVLFLLNDMSSAMTGRVLLADGGRASLKRVLRQNGDMWMRSSRRKIPVRGL